VLYHNLRNIEATKSHVIMKSSSSAFCAGGDIKDVLTKSLKQNSNGFRHNLMNVELISTYKKPYIALMDGLTMGGGAVFSVAGKYNVTTERTSFTMPETAIGFFNDSGATYFLSRLNNNVGLYIGLAGARINGFDVKKIGLASHYVESQRLGEMEKALVACTTEDDIKRTLAKFASIPASTETELDQNLPKIDQCFDGDTVEEIIDNLHLDGSEWAMQTVRALNTKSPTSLKVSHRAIKAGKNLSLHECLKMEFRLIVQHLIESDVKEGVRALLVDKDMKPKWNPPKLHDVKEEHLERFFGPLPNGDELTFATR